MTPINTFAEYYKTITITELLEIIENPDNYQPAAVEAANIEMANRAPSEIEMADAKEYFISLELEKEKRKTIELKAKAMAINFAEKINPVYPSLPTIYRQINIVSAGYALIFIVNFISTLRYFPAYFKDLWSWPLSSILFFENHLILLLAVFFFWQRTTIGWQLLAFFSIKTLCEHLWFAYRVILERPHYTALMQKIFPKPGLHVLLFQLIISGGTIYFLLRPDIREIFKIDNKKCRNTIAFSVVLTIAILLFI